MVPVHCDYGYKCMIQLQYLLARGSGATRFEMLPAVSYKHVTLLADLGV